MAITSTDTVSTASNFGSTTLSWTHTAGGNGLFVTAGAGPTTVVSVTYNGVAMTQLWVQTDSGAITDIGYFMRNPTAGANTLTITWGSAVDSFGIARGLAGMDVTSDAAAHGTVQAATGGGGGAPSISVSSAAGDLVYSGVASLNATLLEGQTLEAKVEDLAGNTLSVGMESSTASGASTTQSWTGGTFWGQGGVAFKAAAGGGGGRTTKNTRSAPLGVNLGMGWRM